MKSISTSSSEAMRRNGGKVGASSARRRTPAKGISSAMAIVDVIVGIRDDG
jgi:hypothetical protein